MADSSSASDTLSNHSNRRGTSRETPNVEFPYKAAFHKLLKMFSVHPDPYAKLNALYELEHLIIASLTTMARRVRHDHLPLAFQSSLYPGESVAHVTTTSIPTAQAKNLDEAIDNCNKRRSQIIHLTDYAPQNRTTGDARSINASVSTSTDMIVEVMQDLFRDTSIRPKTLFRDLQFIAAFVPASILDRTERGKAFWDAGLAALGLKQDVCRTMIEVADEIVVHYTQTRQTATASAAHAQTHASSSSSSSPNSDIKRYSMQDAAKMWTITAKEGDAVAERELAIFYLTHPELVERTTLPLSRPRDTFKAQVMEMHASSGESDRERNDPATMCVAYHWMELSATGGDELAKKYLRQREELNALP